MKCTHRYRLVGWRQRGIQDDVDGDGRRLLDARALRVSAAGGVGMPTAAEEEEEEAGLICYAKCQILGFLFRWHMLTVLRKFGPSSAKPGVIILSVKGFSPFIHTCMGRSQDHQSVFGDAASSRFTNFKGLNEWGVAAGKRSLRFLHSRKAPFIWES
ncbi:hypothetical protein L1049_013867 [Liquidambar formosana]|uniref:Uncharacterized protein n=1 Tax=Liquidambar formosana TaxID=63359 RepID=A0AAP0WZ44_LIQFO